MLVIAKAGQPVQALEGRTLQWLANSTTGTAETALLENIIDPGGGIPPHYHLTEELLVCLDGEAQVVADGEGYRLSPGDTAIVPARVVHSVKNLGQAPFRMFGIFPSAQPAPIWTDDRPPLDLTAPVVSAKGQP